MAIPTVILLVVVILALITGVIINLVRKGVSGSKLMLLGISIILTGGIIAVDPDSNLVGIEYLIVLSGLIISIIGLRKKD